MSAHFILIDIGGTDIKSATVQPGSKNLENLTKIPFPKFIESKSLYREIDPEELLRVVKNLLDNQFLKVDVILGVLISGQMACWTITNVSNENCAFIVSWQDRRSQENTLMQLSDQLLYSNGGESQPGLPGLGVMHFLKQSRYDISSLHFETMNSWLAKSLCSIDTPSQTHSTDAAASGMYDIYSKEWRPDLLSQDLIKLNYPKVSNHIVSIGHLNNSAIPVFTPVGDQQASLLGSDIVENAIVVNIGTGGQVAALMKGQHSIDTQIRPFFHDQYILTKTHLPAGRLISEILKVINRKYFVEATFETLRAWKLDSSHIIDENELRPENCEHIVERYLGLGLSIEVIVSLILTSMAEVYVKNIKLIRNPETKKIIFAGGVGQKFQNIQTYLSEKLELEIEISPAEETTLQGLANLALNVKTG
jgi:xylulokinase